MIVMCQESACVKKTPSVIT